jgi:hypothetical protein
MPLSLASSSHDRRCRHSRDVWRRRNKVDYREQMGADVVAYFRAEIEEGYEIAESERKVT